MGVCQKCSYWKSTDLGGAPVGHKKTQNGSGWGMVGHIAGHLETIWEPFGGDQIYFIRCILLTV